MSHSTFFRPALVVALLAGVSLHAQGVGNGASNQANGAQTPANNKNVDEAWANVVALTTVGQSSQTPPGQQKKTPAQVNAEQEPKAAAAIQAAQAAKDFYSNNPTHANAPAAKKIEAVQMLQGVTDADKAQEITAQRVATTYCSDQSNSAPDRFEVALLSERVNARANLKGKLDAEDPTESQKIADSLHTEFGNQSDVFNLYASIARGSDMVTARGIATKLTQWPANPEAKEEAQSILTRDALLGKPLSLKVTTIDGQVVDLSKASGVVTVLYFCSVNGDGGVSLVGPGAFKKSLPSTAQLIYVLRNATIDQAKAVKGSAPIAGLFCIDSSDSLPSIAAQLQVRRTPYVFVVNSAGLTAGFGPLAELGNLVTAANK